MNALARTLRVLSLTALCVSLSACISLFPKSNPSQLYRFDGEPPSAEQSAPRPSARFGVVRAGGTFDQASAGDRILTVNGSQAAYIADSRWVSPAATLFNEALTLAFDNNAGRARLLTRGRGRQGRLRPACGRHPVRGGLRPGPQGRAQHRRGPAGDPCRCGPDPGGIGPHRGPGARGRQPRLGDRGGLRPAPSARRSTSW